MCYCGPESGHPIVNAIGDVNVLTFSKHLPSLRVVRRPAIPPVRFVLEDCIRVGHVVGEGRCSRFDRCLNVGGSHLVVCV